jgi:hypothetical protein
LSAATTFRVTFLLIVAFHPHTHIHARAFRAADERGRMSDCRKMASLGAQDHTSYGGEGKGRRAACPSLLNEEPSTRENESVPLASGDNAHGASSLTAGEKIRWISCSRVDSAMHACIRSCEILKLNFRL